MSNMEDKMANLEQEYRIIEEDYGRDMLNFTFTKRYITKLLGNERIVRYLTTQHPDMLLEFEKITAKKDEALIK